jgi:hypothetical protein
MAIERLRENVVSSEIQDLRPEGLVGERRGHDEAG